MSILRFAIVSSTAGSVMNQVLEHAFFRGHVCGVIADRVCPAIEKAQSHGCDTQLFLEDDPERFCERLLDYLDRNRIDYVFSYYTKFYAKPLREEYQDRIINFHPSLLPAFKGLEAFAASVTYGAKFVGNTVEFIDHAMDEGKTIMQTVCPLDATVPSHVVRHRLFVQQCQALLQVAKWLSEDRISVQGRRVTIEGARFDSSQFSPALDFSAAQQLSVPLPDSQVAQAVGSDGS